MSELFEKSMATLELPQVLALLADCAATLEERSAAWHCVPSLIWTTWPGRRRRPPPR